MMQKKMFEKISKRQDVPRDIKGRSIDMLNFFKNKTKMKCFFYL